jgi:hypothetical protein
MPTRKRNDTAKVLAAAAAFLAAQGIETPDVNKPLRQHRIETTGVMTLRYFSRTTQLVSRLLFVKTATVHSGSTESSRVL